MQEILLKLEASRKELLDLGLRNPLLNYKPSVARGVHVVQESTASVYDILVEQSKAMTFKAAEKEERELEKKETTVSVSDLRLQTAESEEKLQQKLLNTYYAARTSLEEQGVNILYLALGMLHWYESESSAEMRKAPLILIPVSLERSTARERFKLRYTGEEVGENLSLQAKMKAEFGIHIPDLPEQESMAMGDYFDAVANAVEHYSRWQVERNAIELGFFSFGKFLIYNDLDNVKWPDDIKPVNHPVLQSLFSTGFTDAPPSASEDAFIDDETDADRLFQVVDADSSQLLAMLAVHEGRNLVIQGPPGTGKSQTITNMIANAIGQGKKVLFVAEKLAALEVVKRRLDAIHLGEACLELHSHKGSKKELHAELKRVLDLGKPALQNLEQQVALLEKHRRELNDYSKAINTELQQSGLTAHQLIGLLLQLNKNAVEQLPQIRIQNIHNWNAPEAAAAESMADKLQALLSNIGIPTQQPFWGSGLTLLLPQEQEALLIALKEAFHTTETLIKYVSDIAHEMQWPQPQNREETMRLAQAVELAAAQPPLQQLHVLSPAWHMAADRVKDVLQVAQNLQQLHQQFDPVFLPEAWQHNVQHIRGEMVAHGHKWYRFFIGSYNKAQKEFQTFCREKLPKKTSEKIALADAILQAQRLENSLKQEETLIQELFGSSWQKDSDWSALQEAAHYLAGLHKAVDEGVLPHSFIKYIASKPGAAHCAQNHQLLLQKLGAQGKAVQEVSNHLALNEALLFGGAAFLHQPFTLQQQMLERWISHLPQIHAVIAWNNIEEEAKAEGLEGLTEAAACWSAARHSLKQALQKTWYGHLLQKAFTDFGALRKFERSTHEEVARQFARLDVLNLQLNRARAALRH
ncbi:MAG: DUF4011 domain-containing protein [Chitinophagaceae bacterium]